MVRRQGGGSAIASFVLGLISMLNWLIPPIFGLPIAIVGLVLGIMSRQSPRRGLALAGIVLSIIGLVLAVANAAIGAYLGATGRLRFF